jgi:exopolysaccharide production protein ExoY
MRLLSGAGTMLRLDQSLSIDPPPAGPADGSRIAFADAPAAPVPDASSAAGRAAKRAMDIVLAAVAIVLLSPVMAATALLVRLTMGAPVVFAHRRVGLGGRAFRCFKFRTMVGDAEEVLSRHLAADPAAAAEWRETRKLRDDPRVTPLGRMLRKSSLDELPQLFNVLRGEMSCVGPRPVVEDELARYGAATAAYLSVRPGVTGAWQAGGRSSVSYEARVALDRAYVQNWSLWGDVVIILRTIPALMSHGDAA